MSVPPGELCVIAFVVIAVLSAIWWPRLGAAVGELLVKRRSSDGRD
jgi:hypothetical protein